MSEFPLHPIDVIALYCPEDSKALAELRADAQALADVRTLDAAYGPEWYPARGRDGDVHIYVRGESGPLGVGATPDEARSKAAAWVRKQAAPLYRKEGDFLVEHEPRR